MLYDPKWQTTQDLLAARDYLVEKGWCQGRLRDGDKRCALGALMQVITGFDTKTFAEGNEAYWRVMRAEQRISWLTKRSVTLWNDDPETTKDNVLDVLARA